MGSTKYGEPAFKNLVRTWERYNLLFSTCWHNDVLVTTNEALDNYVVIKLSNDKNNRTIDE